MVVRGSLRHRHRRPSSSLEQVLIGMVIVGLMLTERMEMLRAKRLVEDAVATTDEAMDPGTMDG